MTISADFNIGPIFFGVLIPDKLSITQTPFISLMYGEQRLHNPADSVIKTDNPKLLPHCTTSSIFDTKKWSGHKAPEIPFFTGIPAFSYNLSSSVYRQSNFTTPTDIPCFFSASTVFKITLVFPEDGGPENITKFIIFS